MRKFIKNSNHVAEAMMENDVEIAELELVELIVSFHEWKVQQKGGSLENVVRELKSKDIHVDIVGNKKGSAPTLPVKNKTTN